MQAFGQIEHVHLCLNLSGSVGALLICSILLLASPSSNNAEIGACRRSTRKLR